MPPKKASEIKQEEKAPMPESKPAATNTAPMSSDTNLMAAIAELLALTIIIPLIIYLVKKDDKFVRFHALQSTAIGILVFVINVPIWVISFFVGITAVCAFAVWGIGALVALYAAYMAYQGQMFKLPVLGDMLEKF